MDDDLSTDAFAISPRQPEDQTNSQTQTIQDRISFPIKDQNEQNIHLPPDTRNITCSQSENDPETIYVRHKEEVKDLGDIDMAHTRDETEIKTPEPDLSMPETQETQKARVGNNDDHDRQVNTSNQWRELCLPPNPPLDWRLNELLDYIASHVDETELKRIKLMFTGPQGIGKGVLEKCDSFLELLTLLKQRGFISRDNILYLNKILYVLQRQDLLEKTVEYCVKEGDVIHFYSVDRSPDVGEKQIRIHVKADVQNYNKEQLDRLRNVVASIICIPPDQILISAVEPGSSFIVTFTVTKMYVDILQSLLDRKVNLRSLTAIDVDIIVIDSNQYDVSGHDDVKDVNEQCKELMNVYKQLETTRKELEKMEIINMNCLEELRKVTDQLKKAELTRNYVETLESRNSELVTLCSMLQSMHFTYGVTESSIKNFQLLMTEASNKKQDKDLIQRIIRTNTEIVAACHRNRNELDHQEKSTKIGKKKCNEFELRRDLASGVKNAEEVLNEYYGLCFQDFNLKHNFITTKALQETSKTLSTEQKTKLVNMFQWPKNDVIKGCIDADEKLLLLGVECMEAMMEHKQVKIDDMLARCGKTIGLDLVSTFNYFCEQLRKEKSKQESLKFNETLIQLLEEHTNTAQEIICMFTENVFHKVLPPANIENRSVIQKCRGLCFFLNDNERQELFCMNNWHNDDVVRKCIHEDTDLLIFGLLIKHIEQVNQWIPPETFLAEIQRKLKRSDLPSLFQQLKATEDEQHLQLKYLKDKMLKESNLLQDLKSKRKSAEYVLKQKLTNYTVKLVENIDIANGPQFSSLTKLLRDISTKFTFAESDRLIQHCQWDDNDVIRECIRVDNTLLIQGLWQKQIEEMQNITKPDKFLLDVCEEVDRIDIYNMFKENEILLLVNDKHLYHMMNKSFENLESHLDLESSKHEKETVVDEAGAKNVSAKSDSLNVTHQQRLNEMWKRTGEKEKLYEECEKISQLIESMSSSIIHVWPAYDTNANDVIVFVVLTKSMEEKMEVEHELTKKFNYNIFVKNVDSTTKESEEAMEKTNPCEFEKEKIVSVINKNSDRLLQNHQYLSAISGSSVRSQNCRSGQPQPCIVLYVIAKGKIPLQEHKFEDQIDGIPVVVREGMFETTTLPSQNFFRPVKMGCQITSDNSLSYGTLGGFYYHKDLGLCGITCAHVVLAETTMHNLRGEKKVWKDENPFVYQPHTEGDRYRLGPVKEAVYRIGNEHSSGIDMAIFKIEDRAPESGQFPTEPDICFETGQTLGTSGLRYNTQVLKYGRTTELTRGYIEFENTTVRMIKFEREYTIGGKYSHFLLKNQIEIRPTTLANCQMFNDYGDSGAFVFAEDTDKKLACIGMCVGKLNRNGIVIPISVINEELGVSQFYDFRWNHSNETLKEMGKNVKEMDKNIKLMDKDMKERDQKMKEMDNNVKEMVKKLDKVLEEKRSSSST